MGGLTLLVETPATRTTERDYALSVLLRDWLAIEYRVERRSGSSLTTIALAGDPTANVVELPDVLLGEATAWLAPSSLPGAPLGAVVPPAWTGLSDPLPVIYPDPSASGELVVGPPERARLGFDLLGAMFVLLSGYEARVQPSSRDAHGRIPAGQSWLGRSGWLGWPVLDMYLHVFVAVLQRAWPGLDLRLSPGEVAVSHDVDHPSSASRWHGKERLRTVAGDLVRRRDPLLATRRLGAFATGSRAGLGVDPYDTFAFLMDTSEQLGLLSTFYFLAANSDLPYGSRYALSEPFVVQLLGTIAARGHHIGLHGSYPSWLDSAQLRSEWDALAAATATLPVGVVRRAVRQHFLRLEPGSTWRAQAAAGLEEDGSYGYPDSPGFRAGTARSFTAYDVAATGPVGLRVAPLHVMDVSLTEYLRLDADAARASALDLSRRTRRYGGTFSVLWHNSSLETASARRLYRAIIEDAVR